MNSSRKRTRDYIADVFAISAREVDARPEEVGEMSLTEWQARRSAIRAARQRPTVRP